MTLCLSFDLRPTREIVEYIEPLGENKKELAGFLFMFAGNVFFLLPPIMRCSLTPFL